MLHRVSGVCRYLKGSFGWVWCCLCPSLYAGAHEVWAVQGGPAYVGKLSQKDLGAAYVLATLQDT